MCHFKIIYVLLDLKKVVISIYFSVKICIEFEILDYQLVFLVNQIFLIKIFCFLDKFTYLLLVYTRQKLYFLLFNQIHCCQFAQLEHKLTPTLPKGIIVYKTLIFALDFSYYSHIYKKKLCKYFVLLTNVIVILKNGISY